MKVIKSRFVAYQLYKDGKRIPGLLTVMGGRLLPELGEYREPYIAAREFPTKEEFPLRLFDLETKENIKRKANYAGADRVVRVIMEQEYVSYK